MTNPLPQQPPDLLRPLDHLLHRAVALAPDDPGEAMARDWLAALLENGETASSKTLQKEPINK
jgi:hypothetical protein